MVHCGNLCDRIYIVERLYRSNFFVNKETRLAPQNRGRFEYFRQRMKYTRIYHEFYRHDFSYTRNIHVYTHTHTRTHTRVTRRHARTDTWDSTRSDFWVGVHRARLLVNIPANISPFYSFSFFFFFSPPPLSLPLLFRPSTSRFSPSVRSFFFLFSRRHVRETAPRAEPISRRRSSSEFWNAFERKNLERARARARRELLPDRLRTLLRKISRHRVASHRVESRGSYDTADFPRAFFFFLFHRSCRKRLR